jgi:Asp-tRNA(Asn)/Glu-tRNA(Gln) amidotransferase A subunit family amidase
MFDINPYQDPRKPPTASCVAMLERKGSVIVAETMVPKTGLPSEAANYMDTSSPQSLQGDRYLTPAGSSSGGCAALTTYEGLDAAIGLCCLSHFISKSTPCYLL